jgi:DNA-binding response OmpR family regulator
VRLLVVEDQPAVLSAVVAMLRAEGHDVREAATVAAALAALDDSTPEAVVLDLVLDAPSSALRERLRVAKIPALLMSGAPEGDVANIALAHGWQVLPKPFEPEDLISRVERLTSTPHRRPTMPPPSPPSLPTALPALPTVEPPPAAHDPVRDRLRVVLDRAIYAGALVSVVLLAERGKLDLQTLAAILLVAGVRPHNLFEAMRGGGGRPAMLLPILLDNLRGGTWLAR